MNFGLAESKNWPYQFTSMRMPGNCQASAGSVPFRRSFGVDHIVSSIALYQS